MVTRADLPPGVQAVQAVHAAIEFALAYPHRLVDTVALLAARDELELSWLLSELHRANMTHRAFREPGLGDALTAVAIDSAGARFCRKYPLALEEK